MKKKILIAILLIIFLLGAGFLLAMLSKNKEVVPIVQPPIQMPSPESKTPSNIQPKYQPDRAITKVINSEVPFIVQAPFQNWDEFIFQNACEEASIVMAMGWINGVKKISPDEAQKQILEIVKYEDSAFGYNTDTDTQDVEKIFRNYFEHENVTIGRDIAAEDIKNELQNGSIIITPMFGQALGNPYFTSPGPIAHMLVITGYDPKSGEFITNDPGTKRGSGYRYTEKVLFDAIWEYPSGKDAPPAPTGIRKKSMIVVRK